MTVYCARDFSAADIQTIRRLMQENPALQRSPLSRQLCELWNWRKPNGELKDMTCRVALLRLQAAGLIELAPSKFVNGRRRPEFLPTTATNSEPEITAPVHELGVLTLRLVSAGADSRLFNEFIARYHYLGYTPMSGSQLRYWVFAGAQLVACVTSVEIQGESPPEHPSIF